MAGIIRPGKFVQQPQYVARVDFGHKLLLGAGYVFAVLGGQSVIQTRILNQQFGDPAGVGLPTPRGRGYGSNNTYYVLDEYAAVQNSGDPHTIFGVWQQLDIVNANNSFGQNNGPGGNTIRLFAGATPSYDVYLGGYRSLAADSVPALGSIYSFAGVHTGSAQYTLLNGKRQTATGAFSGGGLGSPWTGFGLGNPANAALLFGVIFKGVVPDSVIAELGSNPWQVFKAPSRKIWIASAASGSSGTVAVTNANDTLSASGTTTVTGSLAKTNASDTSAASGTTTVTGSLAKTNANDTLNASGAVGSGVTGSLAKTNANDTSAASGTTTVTGSLSRQNANDTGVASGTTTVTGSLAKTNANDTLAASGFVGLITGTVAVTNENDTVSARGSAGNPVTSFSGGIYVSREDRAERRKKQRIELGIVKEEKTALVPSLDKFEISNLSKKKPVLAPAVNSVDLAEQEALNAELKRLIALQVESEEEEILKILMEL